MCDEDPGSRLQVPQRTRYQHRSRIPSRRIPLVEEEESRGARGGKIRGGRECPSHVHRLDGTPQNPACYFLVPARTMHSIRSRRPPEAVQPGDGQNVAGTGWYHRFSRPMNFQRAPGCSVGLAEDDSFAPAGKRSQHLGSYAVQLSVAAQRRRKNRG